MKPSNKERLFNYYAGYWIIKLGLHKKYAIDIRKDNRLEVKAVTIQESYTHYTIAFNTKNMNYENEIIHVVLHEIGHLCHYWNSKNRAYEEYFAESFALTTAKEFYPKLFKYMVKRTIAFVKEDTANLMHVDGYKRALKTLGIDWR